MVFTMLKSPALTRVTFVTVVSFLVTASYGRVMVGEKTDMGDVSSNKEVQELGRFSVDKYNEKVEAANDAVFAVNDEDGGEEVGAGEKKKVEFIKVVEATKQVVVGTKYFLKIWAVDEKGRYREFDSVVEVKPWLNQKANKLISFAPSQQRNRDCQKEEEEEEHDVVLNNKFISSA